MKARDLLAMAEGIPPHEAIRLLAAATGRSRSDVLVGVDVTSREQKVFLSFLERRLADEPLQYIEGSVPFGPVELVVDPRVLIPRPETEYLFELVASEADDPRVIVDLCTGSGNLALALGATFPEAEVYAVDLSDDAIAVARLNAAHNDLDAAFFVGNLFDPLPEAIRGSIDLLVSNPPYLAQSELAAVPADVLAEPKVALVAGVNGDEVLEDISTKAVDWLAPGALIACEISEFHPDRIAELFSGYDAVIREDLTGRKRYVFGSVRFK